MLSLPIYKAVAVANAIANKNNLNVLIHHPSIPSSFLHSSFSSSFHSSFLFYLNMVMIHFVLYKFLYLHCISTSLHLFLPSSYHAFHVLSCLYMLLHHICTCPFFSFLFSAFPILLSAYSSPLLFSPLYPIICYPLLFSHTLSSHQLEIKLQLQLEKVMY